MAEVASSGGEQAQARAEIPEVRGALGQRLIRAGKLTEVQLEYALQKQAVSNRPLGRLLVELGLVTEADVAILLAEQRGIDFVPPDRLPAPAAELLDRLPREVCLNNGFLPLGVQDGVLDLVLGDGLPEQVADIARRRLGLRCRMQQSEFTPIQQLVRHHYYFAQNPVDELIRREVRSLMSDVDRTRAPERLLEYILHLAVRDRGTDIHIDPAPGSYHLLVRVDGVLRPVFALSADLARLLVYIKIQAELDISEQRKPQDGSFRAVVLEQPHTIRVSTLITEHGERMVLRLLPERVDLARLEQLGFLEEDVGLLRRMFSKPSGMVLMTGPTGSGKSTTLHAALRLQALIERNVLTVEDPIEYRLPTICQTEVNRRAGYDFNVALRHFLRHDPDVILVGEIRDPETAQAAVVASATGHLVLSTLHVGSVFGVVPRLVPMGLRPDIIADNLLGVVNQRLLRRNCPFCSEPEERSEAVDRFIGADTPARLMRGKGCDRCGGSGYLGRMPLYEILEIDEALAARIAEAVSRHGLIEAANERGFRPMVDLARRRVADGETTLEEVERVLGEGGLR
ncbi:MAG: GspE/PulE family protein [Halothiobacillaceae bacterium]